MSESTGCKIALTALIVAIVMGGLGFATGFLTHAVIAAEPVVQAPGVVEMDATPAPLEVPTGAVTADVPEIEAPSEPAPTIPIPSDTGTAFDLFWEAWELIQRDYYGDLPTEEEMAYGAIRGAINTLGDPFTAFIEPDAAAINREDDTGSFEGIGAYVTMDEGRLMIVSTFKGQPAEEAGLRRGDIVMQVDDVVIENMNIYEAISLIRGPAGTMVRLLVFREGEEPFEVEIVRASIDVPVVEYEMREDGIAYVQLLDFSTDASEKLADAVEEMLEQNPTGLVLDLRGNPGGWLNEAVLTTGLFLPRDSMALIERFKDGTERPYTTPNRPVTTDLPMVVLVDGGSASASEIVAGALQDLGRAVLIGEQTFGKGSVQWPHELSNGAELRVTVARWFTPNDRAIHGEGLAPDVVVELTEDDFEAGLDPQLDRAVEYLLEEQ
ncbi:MAG: S41 family peptidase [Anaerolineae bacterium]|nr:S41 family peptidase [Anaerolineae bacterium]